MEAARAVAGSSLCCINTRHRRPSQLQESHLGGGCLRHDQRTRRSACPKRSRHALPGVDSRCLTRVFEMVVRRVTAVVGATHPRRESGIAVAMVLGSCVSLQFGAALAAQLFGELGSWGVTTLRLGIAALVMLLLVRPRFSQWERAQWRAVVLFGLALGGMNGSFYMSISYIPMGTAVAIEFLGPLTLAAVMSRRPRDAIWVLVALGAMVLFGIESFSASEPLHPTGVLFAVIAGAFWAMYILTSARVGAVIPGAGGLAAALVIATLLTLPLGASGAIRGVSDPGLLMMAIGIAFLASVIPYSLELSALRLIPARVFGVLLSLEPVVASLAGWLLLQQTLGALAMLAIGLVVCASIGSTLTARTPPAGQQPVRN